MSVLSRQLYRSLLNASRKLGRSPAGRLLIYKDDQFVCEDKLYTKGELQYLSHLKRYLGVNSALLGLTEDRDITTVIKDTFRSSKIDSPENIDAGFLALRELTKKAAFAEKIGLSSSKSGPKRSGSTTLSVCAEPLERIHPGSYLVAHPLLTGYFSRSVIQLVKNSKSEGTVGLIVNKPNGETGEERRIDDFVSLR